MKFPDIDTKTGAVVLVVCPRKGTSQAKVVKVGTELLEVEDGDGRSRLFLRRARVERIPSYKGTSYEGEAFVLTEEEHVEFSKRRTISSEIERRFTYGWKTKFSTRGLEKLLDVLLIEEEWQKEEEKKMGAS